MRRRRKPIFPSATMDRLVRDQLRNWRHDGDFWTSDIASALGLNTRQVRNALYRLESRKEVVRVFKGAPASWAYLPDGGAEQSSANSETAAIVQPQTATGSHVD